MSIDDLKSRVKEKMALASSLGATVCFDLGEDGVFYLDAREAPAQMVEEMDDPDLTLKTSLETFTKILDGTQDPNIAYMMGKLKVKGPIGLAMKLNSLLED